MATNRSGLGRISVDPSKAPKRPVSLGEKGQHLIVNGNRRGRWQVTGDEGPVSSWLRYIPPRSGGWPVLHMLASGNMGGNPKPILLGMPIVENKKFDYYRNGKYGAWIPLMRTLVSRT